MIEEVNKQAKKAAKKQEKYNKKLAKMIKKQQKLFKKSQKLESDLERINLQLDVAFTETKTQVVSPQSRIHCKVNSKSLLLHRWFKRRPTVALYFLDILLIRILLAK